VTASREGAFALLRRLRGCYVGSVVVRASPFISRRALPGRSPSHSRKGNRVLIVDDSDMTARMMTQLLTRAGFSVERAANGKVALALWKAEILSGRHFDATLIDKVRARGAVQLLLRCYRHLLCLQLLQVLLLRPCVLMRRIFGFVTVLRC
jgi:hypothetical protein